MKNLQYQKIKDIKFKTELLYNPMPERIYITENRIDAGEVMEKYNFIYVAGENVD